MNRKSSSRMMLSVQLSYVFFTAPGEHRVSWTELTNATGSSTARTRDVGALIQVEPA